MNEAEIAFRFIRAAEVQRADHTHVGPAPLRSMPLPYVHDQVDKNGWGKSPERRVIKKGKLVQGDWLEEGEDTLAAERRAAFELAFSSTIVRMPGSKRRCGRHTRSGRPTWS